MIFLEEKFKGNEFNVVILNDLPFSFLFHIIKEGKLLFAREKDKILWFCTICYQSLSWYERSNKLKNFLYKLNNFINFKNFK